MLQPRLSQPRLRHSFFPFLPNLKMSGAVGPKI
jgi:hypothetical protein